jgi:Tol biopolymer transport system component
MRLAVGAVVLLTLFLTASTADAGYPGRNGLIAFQRDSLPCHVERDGGGTALKCTQSIWTSNLDGNGERRLTTGANAYLPAWSPDGKKLAYLQFVGSKALLDVWIMNADGSGKRRLHRIEAPLTYEQGAEDAAVPRWSADGKSILIGGSKITGGKPPKGYAVALKGAVIAVPTDGAAPRVLFLTHGRFVMNPQPSPSGKLIAYVAAGAQQWRHVLYVARPDGSRVRTVAAAESLADWSPDGHRLVFWRRVDEGGSLTPHLHIVNADGSGLRRITTYPTFVDTYEEAPSWSPDGASILFKSGTRFAENGEPDPKGELFEHRFAVIDPDGGNLHLVGPRTLTCSVRDYRRTCRAVAPVWQPRPR